MNAVLGWMGYELYKLGESRHRFVDGNNTLCLVIFLAETTKPEPKGKGGNVHFGSVCRGFSPY